MEKTQIMETMSNNLRGIIEILFDCFTISSIFILNTVLIWLIKFVNDKRKYYTDGNRFVNILLLIIIIPVLLSKGLVDLDIFESKNLEQSMFTLLLGGFQRRGIIWTLLSLRSFDTTLNIMFIGCKHILMLFTRIEKRYFMCKLVEFLGDIVRALVHTCGWCFLWRSEPYIVSIAALTWCIYSFYTTIVELVRFLMLLWKNKTLSDSINVDRTTLNGFEQCVICLELLTKSPTLMRLPKCGHMFCSLCILTWINTEKTCPCCRSKIILESVIDYEISDFMEHYTSPTHI